MASTNLKELSKALTSALPTLSLPLPDELVFSIDGFIQTHRTHDDKCAELLHNELLSLHHKLVEAPNSASLSPAFFATVGLLAGNLRSQARVQTYWDIGRAFLDDVVKDKTLLCNSSTWIQGLLGFGDGEGDENSTETFVGVNPLLEKLVDTWITDYHEGFVGGAQAYHEKVIRETVLQYGKKKPKRFFTVMDTFFVRKDTRKAALTLMIELVQTQPPRLHLVMQTPIFASLLRCLQYDTSTAVVSTALTLTLVLLPNMPSALAPHLPTLFNIYARLLFWNRERADPGDGGEIMETKTPCAVPGWEIYPYSPEHDEPHIPRLINYFTLLYGLFPINFMGYIRKPQRYLRHFDAENSGDCEAVSTEIRQKSEPFCQCHVVHPNFYTTTMESERTDFDRWIKSEPADITAECMALCLAPEAGGEIGNTLEFAEKSVVDRLLDDPTDQESPDLALLSGSATIDSWRNTRSVSPVSSQVPSYRARTRSQSSRPSVREPLAGSAVGSPALAPQRHATSSSHAELQDMIYHNRAIKLGINQSLPNNSVPSLALSSHLEPTAEGATQVSAGTASAQPPDLDSSQHISHLQRQITLLQNDLRFERYLRQQHVAHIGSLRRKQLSDIVTEAETQNIILLNRSLKNRLAEAKKAEMQARKESEKSRSMSKKWESDVYAKLRATKEEAKKMKAEENNLRRKLEESRQEIEKLKELVCAAEDRELASKQELQSIEMDSSEVDRLKTEIHRLTLAERIGQSIPNYRALTPAPLTKSDAEIEHLYVKLEDRERELEQIRSLYDAQIWALKAQIQQPIADTEREPRNRATTTEARAMFESALAASRSKQSELQKEYNMLLKKYTTLQSSLLDMRSTGLMGGGGSVKVDSPTVSDYETPFSAGSTSPSNARAMGRQTRVFSEPEAIDGASFNVTPPLESQSTMASPTIGAGPTPLHVTTSWTSEGGVSLAGFTGRSPSAQGGGLHLSRGRKEGKERKSSGLRGIGRFGGSSSNT